MQNFSFGTQSFGEVESVIDREEQALQRFLELENSSVEPREAVRIILKEGYERHLVKNALRSLGYTVTSCPDGLAIVRTPLHVAPNRTHEPAYSGILG